MQPIVMDEQRRSGPKPRKRGRRAVGISEAEETYIPAVMVLERYSISQMSLHRWLRNPEMKFPKPFLFGRFRYWKLSELAAWERQRATVVI